LSQLVQKKINSVKRSIHRQELIMEDSTFLEKEKQKNHDRYQKNRKHEIETSAKWNREHPEQRNATRRRFRLNHLESERQSSRDRWKIKGKQYCLTRRKSGMGLHIVKAKNGQTMYYLNGVRIVKPK